MPSPPPAPPGSRSLTRLVAALMLSGWALLPPAGIGAGGSSPGTWLRQLGGASRDWGLGVAVAAAGELYVVGYFAGRTQLGAAPDGEPIELVSAGDTDVFLVRLDAQGKPLWGRAFGGRGQDEGRGVVVGPDGSVYITGFFSGNGVFGDAALDSAGASDGFVARVGADGSILWAQRFGGPRGDVGFALAVDGDGGPVVSGYFQATAQLGDAGSLTSAGGTDAIVVRYDAAGRSSWARSFGGPRADAARAVVLDDDGGVTTAGTFEAAAVTGEEGGGAELESAGGTDAFVWRLDSRGATRALRRFGGPGPDSAAAVARAEDGEIWLAGTFHGTVRFGGEAPTSAGSTDAFVARLDRAAQPIWVRTLGGAGHDFGFAVATARREVWVAGFSQLPLGESQMSGAARSFVTRFDRRGGLLEEVALTGEPAIQALSLALTPDGAVAVAGTYRGTGGLQGDPERRLPQSGKFDAFVARLEPEGKP